MYGKILLLLLLAALNYLVWKDRKNIERSGLIFARRTKAGLYILDRAAGSKFWRYVYSFAVSICLVGIPYIALLLVVNSLLIVITPAAPAGISPIIPGTELQGTGLIIPAIYGIIALGLLVVVHEFSHGVAARACRLKVESSGVLMALVLPGAFVQPDQKEFVKAKKSTRMRVAAAGSFANFLLAFLCVVAIWYALSNFGQPREGVILVRAIPGTPAAESFRQYDVIQQVDGKNVGNFTEIFSIVNRTAPNQTLEFKVITKKTGGNRDYLFGFDAAEERTVLLKTASRNDSASGYVGIPLEGLGRMRAESLGTFLLSFAISPIGLVEFSTPQFWDLSLSWHPIYLLKWTAFLSFMVGLVNLLPIKGLDGGWMAEDALNYLSPRHGSRISSVLSYAIIFFLLLNLLPYFR